VRTFRILHVLRAPIGGLFRHVIDLAGEQAARGHAVGIIADSSTGDARAAEILADLAPQLELGLTRVPMSRDIGPRDFAAARHVSARAQENDAHILHGHGAKGGAYARLARGSAVRAYTPHGGSLHYAWGSPIGAMYLTLERMLKPRTDLFLFESEYGRRTFESKLGAPHGVVRVVHNGVRTEELEPVEPDSDAVDLIYVGEMRWLKGVDVLLEALALLAADGWNGNAILYGAGPDRAEFESRAAALGLAHQVHFHDPEPARLAFRTGRVLVVPSRAESLPYIVLEAAAAGIPLAATKVGGIPEIFGPDSAALGPPEDAAALAAAMRAAIGGDAAARTARLRARIAALFTVPAMTEQILNAYEAASVQATPPLKIHR
jgi:glycosyltransferase involved in cell wall biosynthesis